MKITKGTIGYVWTFLGGIIVIVMDIEEKNLFTFSKIEVKAIGGDGTCVWIKPEQLYWMDE